MRVLYFPEPSMRSYKTGLWHLESASMMVRMRSLVYHLPGSWEWIWAVPENQSERSSDVFPHDITVVPFPWQDNVARNRWEFPLDKAVEVIEEYRPQLCIMETAEHVGPMKMAQQMAGVEFPVIALIVYVPLHTQGYNSWPDPLFRQIEGYMHADAVAFNSERERDEWIKLASQYIPLEMIPTNGKMNVWNCLFDPDDALNVREAGRALKVDDGVPTIFYTGRVSDAKRTAVDEFAKALEILPRYNEFRVWVGNPNEAMPWDQVANKFVNYEKHPFGERMLSREEYLQLLWAADVVPIMIPNRTSGFCEAVYTDNSVMCGDSIGGIDGTDIIRIDSSSGKSIVDGLRASIRQAGERGAYKRHRRQQRWASKNHAVHRNMDPVLKTVERVL